MLKKHARAPLQSDIGRHTVFKLAKKSGTNAAEPQRPARADKSQSLCIQYLLTYDPKLVRVRIPYVSPDDILVNEGVVLDVDAAAFGSACK